LPKDLSEGVEGNITLFLEKVSLSEDVIEELRPQWSRPPRLYYLQKIYKEGISLRPIVGTVKALAYYLFKYLPSLLG
jgi:hypothetical protein